MPPPNRRDEQLLEVGVDLLERGQQALAALAVELGDALAQPADRLGQVGALGLERGDLLVQLLGLVLGAQIDRAHVVALADQALELVLDLVERRQLLSGATPPASSARSGVQSSRSAMRSPTVRRLASS